MPPLGSGGGKVWHAFGDRSTGRAVLESERVLNAPFDTGLKREGGHA